MGGDDTLLSPENPCTDRKRLILEELINGRDLATQLQILLQNPSADHGSVSVEEIGVKILRSFTDTLSVLMSCNDSGEVCQIPASTLSSGDQTSVNSGESSKRWPRVTDRRGCYKRRKILDSWTEVSPSTEDGHAWRKYGQKEILNAKFPRKKMASSSIDNTNLRLKPRFCNCGRIASVHVVQTNANGNEGRVYFVCPRKYMTMTTTLPHQSVEMLDLGQIQEQKKLMI